MSEPDQESLLFDLLRRLQAAGAAVKRGQENLRSELTALLQALRAICMHRLQDADSGAAVRTEKLEELLLAGLRSGSPRTMAKDDWDAFVEQLAGNSDPDTTADS